MGLFTVRNFSCTLFLPNQTYDEDVLYQEEFFIFFHADDNNN